jgi:uncharacterized membrane protein YfcA
MDELSLLQYGLVAAVALLAAIVGGVAGYGTGLLLPPVLAPLIGTEAIVPVMSVAGLMTNASRWLAFRRDFDRARALVIIACALPTCLIGAWGYTRLSGAGVALLIGAVLVVIVPARRVLARRHGHLSRRGVAIGGAGFGLLVGGTSGTGVVLLSILLAAGLSGRAVLATDAGISIALGVLKVTVFQSAGALPAGAWLLALLIGLAATPGAFIAKRLTAHLSLRAHTGILDAVVVLGGIFLIVAGLRG